MTVTTAGRTLHIHWTHSTHDGKTREGAGPVRVALDADAKTLNRRLTLCELSEVTYDGMNADGEQAETFNILGQGVAVCHPKDNFSKAAGRKKALSNAMKAAGLDYFDREEVWQAYLAEFPTKTQKVARLIDSMCAGDFDGAEQSSRS